MPEKSLDNENIPDDHLLTDIDRLHKGGSKAFPKELSTHRIDFIM